MRRHVLTGSAEALHARPMPTGDTPELWVMRPTAPAVVMGSAQRPADFDLARLDADGVELASRRTGGGAVYIEPAAVVWLDLLAPRGTPWWHDDLADNFAAVGEVWHEVLGECGVEAVVHRGPPERSPAVRAACWAGVGWGEVTVGPAKLVGLSQRRTRWGARIQAMAVLDGSAVRVADYLRGPIAEQVEAAIAPLVTTDAMPAADRLAALVIERMGRTT